MSGSARNLERTGMVVLLAAAVVFAGAMILPRLPWTPTREYWFTVPLAQGVKTLTPGSTVQVSGLSVGEVTSIESISSADGNELKVAFSLSGAYRLRLGAAAQLTSGFISAGTTVDLVNAFDPAQPELDSGRIDVLPPKPAFEVVFGAQRWAKIQEISARLQSTAEWFPRARTEFEGDLESIRGDLAPIASSAAANSPRWAGSVESIREDLSIFKERTRGVADESDGVSRSWHRLASAFAAVRDPFKTVAPAAGGNIAELGLLDSLPEFSRFTGRFDRLAEAAVALSGTWTRFVAPLRGPWEWLAQDLDIVRANTTLTSGQFDAFLADAKSDPLPYLLESLAVVVGTLPSMDMLEREHADECIRQFARAASDLREAVAAIESWRQQPISVGLQLPPHLRERLEKAKASWTAASEALFRLRMSSP